jgi:riboflavin biosynthesis pyrimidine reductase
MSTVSDVSAHLPWARDWVRTALARGGPERVIGMMVSSLDARAALAGRSRGLSSPADRALIRAWRGEADLLLVGARTLETERYRSVIPDEDRDVRESLGRSRVPRIVTVSRQLDLDLDVILEVDPEMALTVYTSNAAAATHPSVEIVALGSGDELPLDLVLADIRGRREGSIVLCEGGPGLLARLLEERLLTDLSLTLSPLVIGDGPVVWQDAGGGDPQPVALAELHRHDDFIFAHYLTGTAVPSTP